MAESQENDGEGLKNLKNTACRASREGRVPCPHHDCDGNAVFFQKGAGLDVHYRSKHGTKSDATTEKTAKQKLSQLCFEEMKQKLQDIEANEQTGEEFAVTSVSLTVKITATRPEQAAKKAGVILHAGSFLHSYSSGLPPYAVTVQGKSKEVHYHLWYVLDVHGNMRYPAIVCKPFFVKTLLEEHQSNDGTTNNAAPQPFGEIGETEDGMEDPLEECLRKLSKLAELQTQIVACTATATPTTKEFIITNLQMGECRTFYHSVDRRNIQYCVQLKGKTREVCHGQVCEVVLENKDQCGIVYCQTVSDVKDIHYHLQENGVRTVKYHGTGTGQNEREGRQSLLDWQRGLKDVLVATKAAGAGIDKPDVRFVVHLGCPSSVPDYLQESGRAGRDGRLAKAVLLYSPKDKSLHVKRIGEIQDEAYRAGAIRRLSDIINFCETELCRRKILLEAFAEDTTSFECNKTCDNCLNPTVAREIVLTTEAARMVRCVSAIRHTVTQPPSSLLARVFLGLGSGQEVKKQKLDQLPEFGLGKNSGFNLKMCERFIRKLTRIEILQEVLVPVSDTRKFASLYILPGRMAESTIQNDVNVTLFIR
uniref:DNA 3'-5' helicase n=1 Tax=Branchiostoma floridae TaxID=7739 RepID=C3Y8N4_BRAFL|eukprot:XP_002607461.1 hypothetical protein BRAFLDRAFT_69893 [Branchiostoma floridae]